MWLQALCGHANILHASKGFVTVYCGVDVLATSLCYCVGRGQVFSIAFLMWMSGPFVLGPRSMLIWLIDAAGHIELGLQSTPRHTYFLANR